MEGEYLTITSRLLLAVLAGGIIGLERTFHGRPAGFRTHTLVCTSSTLLMLLMVYQWQLIEGAPLETVRIDPTRMAQGIMTGIGFLGAGVIMKEGLSIRGLTTAASIWMTAAIGIIIGMGFHFAALLATLITLGTLAVFRWIESVMPTLSFGKLTICFLRRDIMPENDLRELLLRHGIKCGNSTYVLNGEGKMFQYAMTIKTRDRTNFNRLAETLEALEQVQEFSIDRAG